MPKVQVGEKIFHAEEGKKLVLALEDHGIDILHMCGGNAKCGTCRVEVLNGELELISPLEERALSSKGIQTDGHGSRATTKGLERFINHDIKMGERILSGSFHR